MSPKPSNFASRTRQTAAPVQRGADARTPADLKPYRWRDVLIAFRPDLSYLTFPTRKEEV